jgi:hypothetical protein
MRIAELRRKYHHAVGRSIIRIQRSKKNDHIEYPNFADVASPSSIKIAWGIVERIGYEASYEVLTGQTVGDRFEELTKDFLENAFSYLAHLRPGNWLYSTNCPISQFEQYQHLARLEDIVKNMGELAAALGTDYIITPDIVIGRTPVTEADINRYHDLVAANEDIATHTPLRSVNSPAPLPILHASVSCKWTLRSDRGQNARTEALNLIRNRKGRVPHVVAVTAEPMIGRIASLALGTGDLDCTYHFALYELQAVINDIGTDDQKEQLQTLIDGKRLRDISDLPFDMAI